MTSNEVQFLKDQVRRQNEILAAYQSKYGAIREQDASRSEPNVPWLTDKNLMSPLMAEYDSQLEYMRDKLRACTMEQKELRSQLDKLLAENKRLNHELKDVVQSQLNSFERGMDNSDAVMGELQIAKNLQDQQQILLQERNNYYELWELAVHEVDRLEKELESQKFNPKLRAVEMQASQIKEEYMKTVGELNSEIEGLQDQNAKTLEDLRVANNQIVELRKALVETRTQANQLELAESFVAAEKDRSVDRLSRMEKNSAQAGHRLEETERELADLKEERGMFEKRLIEMQKKSTEHEQREYVATLQVRESVQMVENAMLEKEQALQREQQAQGEIERLKEAITLLVDEAGARTRQEIDVVKRQFNANISNLMEQVQNLETDNAEKQSQIERAVREKRKAESELEKILNEHVRGAKDNNVYDELVRRACNAERVQSETAVKLDALQQQTKRAELVHKQERKQLENELEQLRERLKVQSDDFASVDKERLRAVEKLDETQKQLGAMQRERDSAQRSLAKEKSLIEHDFVRKQKEFDVKLQAMEDAQRQATTSLRQMLASQQRVSTKWKEECNIISQKYEAKLAELRADHARLKSRSEEITKLLRESQEKITSTEEMISEYTKHIQRLEERLRFAEERARNAAMQSTRMTTKNRNFTEDRKHLQIELKRSLEEAKNLANRTNSDTVALS